TRVSLLMADAYTRQDKTAEEFAIYDRLLLQTKDPEYTQVLDRYVARLLAVNRAPAAMDVYRREIARTPGNPALYEKLAAFLDQRNLTAQVEAVYKDAAAHFPGGSWDQNRARWYLRRRPSSVFDQLTARIAQSFSGTERRDYCAAVVHPNELGPQ